MQWPKSYCLLRFTKYHGLWSLSKPPCLLLSAFLKTSIMCTVFFLITTILKTLLPLSRHYSMLSLVNHCPQTTAAVKTLLCAATMRTLLFIASNPKARLTNKQRDSYLLYRKRIQRAKIENIITKISFGEYVLDF